MGFRINTNVAALSAHANALSNNRAIDSSLGRLNSGFRINSAADDASGMAIADSLRSQASSLGKAIMNANDAIGIVQTADKAMDEQIKILDTIKEKAIQSAQDGQTTETRKALQADISRLMEELDNIGNTTSFNGQKLLSGTFSNKEFQIGAYSNETVKASIGATTSDKIGLTRFETGHNVRASDLTSVANFTFKNVDGINDVTFEPVQLADDSGNIKAGMGLGALMEAINKASDKTGVKASVTVQSVFEQPIKAGSTTAGFSINGVMIGAIDVKEKDGNGALRSAINSVKDQTGVEASVDSKGRLVLANRDGRGIKVEDNVGMSKPATDMHDLVTTTATGGTMKKGVDLNAAATWTTPADQPGSILNSSNTFADIKMAHGTQDAVIYKDGLDKAKKAFDAVKGQSVVKNAVNDFKQIEQEALNELKKAFSTALDAFKAGVDANNQGTDVQKDLAKAHADLLKKTISEKDDISEIEEVYTKFVAETNVALQTTALGVLQGGTGALKDAINAYEDKLKTAAENTIKTGLTGANIAEGEGKTVLDATATLRNDLNTATANSSAADFKTLADNVKKYADAVKPIQGTISEVPKNAVNKFNSTEAAELGKLKKAMEEAINDFKNAAAQTPGTTQGQQDKGEANAAADKLLDVLKNNDSTLKDVAEAYATFVQDTKVAAETVAIGNVTAAGGKINNAIVAYQTALEKAGTETIKTDLKGTDITKGEPKAVLDASDTLVTALANKATDAAHGTLTTLAGQVDTYKTSTATVGQGLDTTGKQQNEISLRNLVPSLNGALHLEEVGEKLTKVQEALEELKEQTTLSGANASIDKLNGLLDNVIRNAAGKTMDTEEAQQGVYAHAMKQFLAGVKQGLNEPNKEGMAGIVGLTVDNSSNYGRLSLSSTNGRDIQVEVRDANGFTTNSTVGYDKNVAEKTVSLRETNSTIDKETADAMGFNAEEWQATDAGDNINGYPAGVMTLKGAQAMMNIAEAAAKALQAVRSDLGSVQNQLVATVNNISVTQVNVKAAESNIRDVDFAQESATFSKHQILAQSGVYAMSQANAVQQNVMRLLQ